MDEPFLFFCVFFEAEDSERMHRMPIDSTFTL